MRVTDSQVQIKDKALAVIEALSMEGFTGDVIGSIYKYAHVAQGNCANAHEDWVRELETTYKDFKKHGLI